MVCSQLLMVGSQFWPVVGFSHSDTCSLHIEDGDGHPGLLKQDYTSIPAIQDMYWDLLANIYDFCRPPSVPIQIRTSLPLHCIVSWLDFYTNACG